MRSSTKHIEFQVAPRIFSLTPLETINDPAAPAEPGIGVEQLEEACEEAYQRGVADGAARALAEMQEHRDAVGMLQSATLENLTKQHSELVEEAGKRLPEFALEVTRRVLSGWEPSPEILKCIVDEVLAEMAPAEGDVEVWLCERDLALIKEITPELVARHPEIKLKVDPSLAPGDCHARSRFGAVDARLSTKLNNIEKNIRR